jgi:hypothetical protein
MSNVPMFQFLKEYGLILLGASSEMIVPGRIVTRRMARPIAYLKNLLEGTQDEWPTMSINADLPYQVVWDNDLTGKTSLKVPGILTVTGGLKQAAKGTFTISAVRSSVFDKKRMDLDEVRLQIRVAEWGKNPKTKPLYKRVKGHVVAQSTWFASEFTLELEAPKGVDLSATVPVEKITVDGGGEIQWTNKTTLKVKGNERVPFAIQGWVI